MSRVMAYLVFSMAVLSLMVLSIPQAQAADLNDELTVTFTFAQAPTPDYFKLYLAGQPVCQSPDGVVRTFDCSVPPMPYGNNDFTLTAVSGDSESKVSPVHVFKKDINAPTIEKVISVSVQVN